MRAPAKCLNLVLIVAISAVQLGWFDRRLTGKRFVKKMIATAPCRTTVRVV